jgi:hypothetical protein
MALCLFFYRLFLSFYIFLLWISNSFDMSNTEETELVEMRIWRIKIGIALDLHVYMSLYWKKSSSKPTGQFQ